MRKALVIILAVLCMGLGTSGAGAATIDLFEWGFNVNGTIYKPGDALPGYFNTSGFNFATGLGTITLDHNFGGPGSRSFTAFFDHEIDETINTFFNELGTTGGTRQSWQSWEIDEPGYVFGDIYNNFLAAALDKDNGVPSTAPDDVSMAMGWSFTLGPDEEAYISMTIGRQAPGPGTLYLAQTDPDSNETLYFFGTYDTGTPGGVVPEPSTLLLVGAGLLGVAAYGRKRFRN
jgi:hypothetical protein